MHSVRLPQTEDISENKIFQRFVDKKSLDNFVKMPPPPSIFPSCVPGQGGAPRPIQLLQRQQPRAGGRQPQASPRDAQGRGNNSAERKFYLEVQ